MSTAAAPLPYVTLSLVGERRPLLLLLLLLLCETLLFVANPLASCRCWFRAAPPSTPTWHPSLLQLRACGGSARVLWRAPDVDPRVACDTDGGEPSADAGPHLSLPPLCRCYRPPRAARGGAAGLFLVFPALLSADASPLLPAPCHAALHGARVTACPPSPADLSSFGRACRACRGRADARLRPAPAQARLLGLPPSPRRRQPRWRPPPLVALARCERRALARAR